MRNINEYIKDLEGIFLRYDHDSTNQEIMSILNEDDDNNDDADHVNDDDHDDLTDLNFDEKQNEEEKGPSYPKSDKRQDQRYNRNDYRYKALYVSPDSEQNHLNSYLTNCNITSNNTDETSVNVSKGRESGSSLIRHQYSVYRNYTSTSRTKP